MCSEKLSHGSGRFPFWKLFLLICRFNPISTQVLLTLTNKKNEFAITMTIITPIFIIIIIIQEEEKGTARPLDNGLP